MKNSDQGTLLFRPIDIRGWRDDTKRQRGACRTPKFYPQHCMVCQLGVNPQNKIKLIRASLLAHDKNMGQVLGGRHRSKHREVTPPPKLVVVRELQQAADKPGVIRQTGGWLAPGTVMGERVTIPQLTH